MHITNWWGISSLVIIFLLVIIGLAACGFED